MPVSPSERRAAMKALAVYGTSGVLAGTILYDWLFGKETSRPAMFGDFPTMTEHEERQFLEDISIGAKDPLSQVASTKIADLRSGTRSVQNELSQSASDPLALYKTGDNTGQFFFLADKHGETDRYIAIEGIEGRDKPFTYFQLGIGMPLGHEVWRTASPFTKSLMATKETVNAGLTDGFARWVIDDLMQDGNRYQLVADDGTVIANNETFSGIDKQELGLYFFLHNFDVSAANHGWLWRVFDVLPAVTVASGWYDLYIHNQLTSADIDRTPAALKKIADLGRNMPFGDTSLLNHVQNELYEPMVSAQTLRGDVSTLGRLLTTPGFIDSIVAISTSPDLYGPLSQEKPHIRGILRRDVYSLLT